MPSVVFVVPFALPATTRFVRAMAGLDGVRLGVISQEPLEKLGRDLGLRLQGYARVRDVMQPHDLIDGVRRIAKSWGGEVDRVVGVLEQLQVPLAEARAALGIPGMSVDAAQNFRDKSRMKDVLRQHGLPCARHKLARSAAEAIAFANELAGPLVVKPPAGAGAKNTFRVEHPGELESWLRTTGIRPQEPLLLEEFMTGEEYSFDSVSVGGRHVFHSISRYYPTPLAVMETPWIQWCVVLPRRIDTPEFAPILEAGPRALTCLGMDTGITHMEWFRRPDGNIAISEVAARPPGAQFTTLLSYAHELDFYVAWARVIAFEEFTPPPRRYAVGAAFLRGQGAGSVVAVHGIEEAQRELGDLVVEAKLPQKGQPQASSYEGEGYVILRDEDTDRVTQALAKVVQQIRVELG